MKQVVDTNDIRLMVLNILKEGRLKVEEADKIINLINIYEDGLKEKEKNDSDYSTAETISYIAREGVSRIEKLVSSLGLNLEKVANKMNIKTDNENEINQMGEKYIFSDSDLISNEEELKKIHIDNCWGNIKVVGQERNDVELNVEKIIWTKNKEIAEDRNNWFKVVKNINEGVLEITLPDSNPRIKDVVNLELFVPKNLLIDLNTESGDIFIKNISNNIIAKSTSGNVELLDIETEKYNVMSVSGDIILINSTAKTDARTTSGNIEFEGKLLGESRINSISGDIRLEADISDALEVSSSSGNIELKQIRNKFCKLIDLITNSGNINYKGIINNTFRARSNSGDIKGKSIVSNDSKLEINTTNGDITWSVDDHASISFSCESKNGDIFSNFPNDEVEKIPGKLISKEQKQSSSLAISSITGDIKFHRE